MKFAIEHNHARVFNLDGMPGIAINGWYLVGLATGQLGKYGVILFDFFIGLRPEGEG